MGLKRKIRTLLDPEKRLAASFENQRRKRGEGRSFPLTSDGLLRDLDLARLEAIQSRHAIANPGIRIEKYLDTDKWLPANIRRALNLGLDFRPPGRVLDLGSGAGYFLYVCKQLGHQVLGLDLDDPGAPFYAEFFELFGIKRVIWRIDPFVPLPDLGPRFDFVTAFMVCFNRHMYPDIWKIEEWRFFLDDLAKHLNPGAIIWFELNPSFTGDHYTPELKAFFESRGAIVDGKRLVWGMDETKYRILQRSSSLEAVAIRKSMAHPNELNPI